MSITNFPMEVGVKTVKVQEFYEVEDDLMELGDEQEVDLTEDEIEQINDGPQYIERLNQYFGLLDGLD